MSIDDSDLDTALRRWGTEQRSAAGTPPVPPVADLLAARRRRHNVTAVAATVVLVVALAAGLGVGLRSPGAAPKHRPSGDASVRDPRYPGGQSNRPCSQRFADAGTDVDTAHSVAIVVLRYTGTHSCRVFERSQVALLDSAGRVTGPHAPSATLNRMTTVHPGETVRFTVTVGTSCPAVPEGTYSLLVSMLPTARPSPRTGIEVGHDGVHVDTSGQQCRTLTAATATPLHTESPAVASALTRLTRIAHRQAIADGDPTATADAVLTTGRRIASNDLMQLMGRAARARLWIVQLHGRLTATNCSLPDGPTGTSGGCPTGTYLHLAFRQPSLRRTALSLDGRRFDLSELGRVVPLIP